MDISEDSEETEESDSEESESEISDDIGDKDIADLSIDELEREADRIIALCSRPESKVFPVTEDKEKVRKGMTLSTNQIIKKHRPMLNVVNEDELNDASVLQITADDY